MNDSQPLCGPSWKNFEYTFSTKVYGLVVLILNVAGAPLNLLTMIVFTKKHLPASSANTVCTSLAISDFTISILCFPQMWIGYHHPEIFRSIYQDSYVRWIIFNSCFKLQKVFYNISCLQTMMLAVWRYIAVTYPLKERYWCNMKVTFRGIAIIYAICFLYSAKDSFCVIAAPQVVMIHHLGLQISINYAERTNRTLEVLGQNQLQYVCDENFMKNFYSMFLIIFMRTTPSTIIAICTVRFIYVLKKSKKPGEEMLPKSGKTVSEKHRNRTTKMILGIMIFYLTNNVFGIIGHSLIFVYGDEFERDCYQIFDNISNLLVLIYTSIPFVVYYSISQKFRDDVKSLFFREEKMRPTGVHTGCPIKCGSPLLFI